jgi:CRP-like cAMP-binding protein
MNQPSTPHPLEPMLRKLQLWNRLDVAEQEAVLALPYTIEEAEPGRYIVREGDRTKHSCLLISGFAFRQKIMDDGSRSICSIHMRGDIVDLQNSLLRIADHNVQALTRCKLALIPRDGITDLAAAFPNVGMAMWYDTLVDASIFREWLANVGRRSAASAIAHLLCEFGVRLEAAGLGKKLHYELPMSQEQLADCTGLTAVHVNRTLKALETSGDIRRSIRHVAIADWQKIRTTADFRSAYLHLPEDTLLP